GIRDFHVTGVQTCALPILTTRRPPSVSLLSWLTRRTIRPSGAYLRLDVPPNIVEIAAPHPRLMRWLPHGRMGLPLELHRLRRLEIGRASCRESSYTYVCT